MQQTKEICGSLDDLKSCLLSIVRGGHDAWHLLQERRADGASSQP